MRVTDLYRFPVKSLGASKVERLAYDSLGPLWDRNWMLIDQNCQFVTQRDRPTLSQFHCLIEDEELLIRSQSKELAIPLHPIVDSMEEVDVTIWNEIHRGLVEPKIIQSWIQSEVGPDLRLVRISPKGRIRGSRPQQIVRFPDSAPWHLITRESLSSLEREAQCSLEPLRFRPNIVVQGAAKEWDEDRWQGLRVDSQEFTVVKGTSRCSITNLHPGSGQKSTEPLATLARTRRNEKKVFFGIYLEAKGEGQIAVGDEVNIFYRGVASEG